MSLDDEILGIRKALKSGGLCTQAGAVLLDAYLQKAESDIVSLRESVAEAYEDAAWEHDNSLLLKDPAYHLNYSVDMRGKAESLRQSFKNKEARS